MQIEVLANADAVAAKAAEFIAAKAREAVAARGRFLMAVSGGHTPWVMLRALAGQQVPWQQVHVFQVDERIAPPGDPDRNLTHLRESLLEHAPLPPSQIHAMQVELPDPKTAAADYAAELEKVAGTPPVLDLVHLGLGPDGHTASLVPGDPVLHVSDRDTGVTGVYMGRKRIDPDLSGDRPCAPGALAGNGGRKGPHVQAAVRRRPFDPRWTCTADERRAARRSRRGRRSVRRGSMRVGIATDHGGFALKEEMISKLEAAGHEVVDFGAHNLNPGDDYPDFVVPLARAVVAGDVHRGVAICGSGVGASVCVNKIPGVRAALIHDHFSARQGVEDDHMNILCMGGRTVGPEVAWDLVETYLSAEYSQAERHLRRLGKVASRRGAEGSRNLVTHD